MILYGMINFTLSVLAIQTTIQDSIRLGFQLLGEHPVSRVWGRAKPDAFFFPAVLFANDLENRHATADDNESGALYQTRRDGLGQAPHELGNAIDYRFGLPQGTQEIECSRYTNCSWPRILAGQWQKAKPPQVNASCLSYGKKNLAP